MTTSNELELVSANKSFGGWLKRYKHQSKVLGCEMVFAIFLPPAAEEHEVPLLWWLSGLTCTDENFTQKAGAQRVAAELGLAFVCPDTSPRGTDLPGEHDSYDFGSGAGFYLNAEQAPWNKHYRMYDYVTEELTALVHEHFPLNGRQAISGHSMGGHGALICALKNPDRYTSVSAFAPIANPTQCPWGEKAFGGYLGNDRESWKQWDACELIAAGARVGEIKVDQGEADNFYQDGQLRPQALEAACQEAGIALTLELRPGYDHSYFFIASFIDDHLRYHAHHLRSV
ncbi:S-formylglutathione hydrolase [Alloalcanivorax gelatiniphagus]|uniref:S-formylglutathione hydrolase n=1 Tax=Alloalcanivorax gelatiniphagus TaxID=1194167 RepID=A0ABY2XI37_9GAMM|nr:S-formylglutathione hydrolase [Alloalcanivorax gelatiniphagus]TMW10987.1 S-formylglutathione hydrolase [Alloalcanivorax gelatiniphagus]